MLKLGIYTCWWLVWVVDAEIWLCPRISACQWFPSVCAWKCVCIRAPWQTHTSHARTHARAWKCVHTCTLTNTHKPRARTRARTHTTHTYACAGWILCNTQRPSDRRSRTSSFRTWLLVRKRFSPPWWPDHWHGHLRERHPVPSRRDRPGSTGFENLVQRPVRQVEMHSAAGHPGFSQGPHQPRTFRRTRVSLKRQYLLPVHTRRSVLDAASGPRACDTCWSARGQLSAVHPGRPPPTHEQQQQQRRQPLDWEGPAKCPSFSRCQPPRQHCPYKRKNLVCCRNTRCAGTPLLAFGHASELLVDCVVFARSLQVRLGLCKCPTPHAAATQPRSRFMFAVHLFAQPWGKWKTHPKPSHPAPYLEPSNGPSFKIT